MEDNNYQDDEVKDEDHGVRDNEDDEEENGGEEDAGTGRSIWQTENRVEHYHQRKLQAAISTHRFSYKGISLDRRLTSAHTGYGLWEYSLSLSALTVLANSKHSGRRLYRLYR